MCELVGCYPLDQIHENTPIVTSSAPSSLRGSVPLSPVSLPSRASTASTSLLALNGELRPPDRLRRPERLPRPPIENKRAFTTKRASILPVLDSPSTVYPFALAFKKLPDEILDCIVEHLALLRTEDEYRAIVRDLYNLCLANLQWHRIAKRRLYHTIWIAATDLRAPPRKFFTRPKTRLKLLQRTLHEQLYLCHYVRQIRIKNFTSKHAMSQKEIRQCNDHLASIVSICPALERLVGYDWVYTHAQDQMFDALSTRERLREHKWIFGPNDRVWAEAKLFLYPPGFRPPLEEDQTLALLRFHCQSEYLESLSISCTPDGVFHERFLDIFECSHFPALQQLRLSNLDAQDFEARHLQYLPPTIRTLSLDCLPGISERGLIDYFEQRLTLFERQYLQELNLTNINIHSVSSVATILDNLYNLRRLTVITCQLTLDAHSDPDELLYPFLSSKTLQHLHWEHGSSDGEPSLGSGCEQASIVTDTILARSLLADGFPNLQSICAPSDTYGIVQSVCEPICNPLVRVTVASARLKSESSPFDLNEYHYRSMHVPLIYFATSNNSWKTTEPKMEEKDRADKPQSKADSQAANAYRRAANALHPKRRAGYDSELGFVFDVLEEVDPFITLCIINPEGGLESVFEVAPCLGRVGLGVPRYQLLDDHQRGA